MKKKKQKSKQEQQRQWIIVNYPVSGFCIFVDVYIFDVSPK